MNAARLNELWALAARRHGLLTTKEAVSLIGRHPLARLVRMGHLTRVCRGVYRVTGAPPTARQTLMGVSLALGAVAGIRSSAALFGLDGFTLDKPEVLIDERTTRSRVFREELTVRVHYTNFLPSHHIEEVDGIPCTTLVRTLCDLSSVRSVDTLARIVDTCKRRRLIEYADLARCRMELKAQGRRRTTVLDEILAARVEGYEVGESPPEDRVMQWVRAAGFEPSPQHWTVANGKRRRIDVALVGYKVAIEYQGVDAHATQGAVENDSEKVTELQLAGWFVMLVTKKTTKAAFMRDLQTAVEIQRRARRTFPGLG